MSLNQIVSNLIESGLRTATAELLKRGEKLEGVSQEVKPYLLEKMIMNSGTILIFDRVGFALSKYNNVLMTIDHSKRVIFYTPNELTYLTKKSFPNFEFVKIGDLNSLNETDQKLNFALVGDNERYFLEKTTEHSNHQDYKNLIRSLFGVQQSERHYESRQEQLLNVNYDTEVHFSDPANAVKLISYIRNLKDTQECLATN
ncbi:hypothetical protein [Dyadobacter aurulentus]|uniref:hypothetical protein n=1 Tax=Dyadobacter sp. UC 10 TaxID=2605428 RepID=UPI0011F0E57C|nr:hypothetical protein [Dyadobacter sp. UC 10]KAA0992656.1 hypothetical protein FXO21_22015 [Dyadobacter sp. UC 10]